MAQLLEYERVELKERNTVFSGELGIPYWQGQIAQHVNSSDRQRQRLTEQHDGHAPVERLNQPASTAEVLRAVVVEVGRGAWLAAVHLKPVGAAP